jgi:hypothetical protein
VRTLKPRRSADACVDLDINRCGVPWRLLRQVVEVEDGMASILLAGHTVARHLQGLTWRSGNNQRQEGYSRCSIQGIGR